MIILKQDKKGIVNFNNVTEIFADESDEEGNKYFVFYIPVGNLNGIDILGEYKTEERAKEVLREITNTFSAKELNGTLDEMDLILKGKFMARYEMPKE